MGLGVRFDPRVIEAPVGVLGDLLDELVGALTKSAKGGEGDRLEVDVQALLLDDVYNIQDGLGIEPPNWLLDPHTQSSGRNFLH